MIEKTSPFCFTHTVLAPVHQCLGVFHLELEEFEEAQKHMQGSFETHKALYGVKDKRTTGAYLEVAMAARLAGNLQHAKEILEAAEDSLLGKAQPSLIPKLSVGGERESLVSTVCACA